MKQAAVLKQCGQRLPNPILLHRSRQGATALQNRLIRQKFLRVPPTPVLQIHGWNKLDARLRGTAGEKSVAPCVTPVWNR